MRPSGVKQVPVPPTGNPHGFTYFGRLREPTIPRSLASDVERIANAARTAIELRFSPDESDELDPFAALLQRPPRPPSASTSSSAPEIQIGA